MGLIDSRFLCQMWSDVMPPYSPDPATALALRGDRGAWEQLIVLHSRRVTVALLSEGLSMDDAKDLTQDVWARLWNQIQSGALATLQLPGIAVTQARFLARDLRRRRRTVQYEAQTDDIEAPETAVDALLASAQTLAKVQRELGTFEPGQQRIFRLAIEEGVPHASIAQTVGLSTQRVRQIIWEIRVRLRAHLETL